MTTILNFSSNWTCYKQGITIVLLILVLPSLMSSKGNSKIQKVDSLEHILNAHKAFDSTRVDLLNEIGYEYWIMDPNISEERGTEALEISKVLPYPAGEAFASRVVGVSHWARGNLELAFKYLLDAERLYQKLNDSLGLANSTLNLGMTYADRQDFGIAKIKYDQALSIFKKLKKDCRIATTYAKMGYLLMEQEVYDEAYNYLIEALSIYQSQNYLYGISEVNGKLGEMFIKKREFSKSLSHTLLAIEASAQRIDRVGLGKYHFNLGLAHELKGDKVLAEENYRMSLDYAESFNLKNVQQQLYLKFKNLEQAKGNYKNALVYYDKYNKTKDEIFNLELANTIANLESQHSFDQRQKELELAQKNLDLLTEQNKASRSFLFILLLALISVASVSWTFIERQRKRLSVKNKHLQKATANASRLRDEIQQKEQEMASYTLKFVQKNEAISEIRFAIQEIKKNAKDHQRSKMNFLEKKINNVIKIDEDWKDFSKHFENVHPSLIQNLRSHFPNLTNNDYKLISLIRLNLSSKEISSVVGISPDSVKTARYRLRKKLDLNNSEDLFSFLVKYETSSLTLVS